MRTLSAIATIAFFIIETGVAHDPSTVLPELRIPTEADQRSELMAIAIPI